MKPTSMTKSTGILIVLVFSWYALKCHAESSAFRTGPAGQALTGKQAYTVSDSEMVWGETTNLTLRVPYDLIPAKFKIGIRSSNGVIVISKKSSKPRIPASVYLENVYGRPIWTIPASTRDKVMSHPMEKSESFSFVFLPPKNERFAVEMTDKNGVHVPKTEAGANLISPNLGGKQWKHWDKDGRQCLALCSHQDVGLYPLDLAEYFLIDKPGIYKLMLIQHLYIIDTNNLLKEVNLPSVTVDVKVE